ncbi:MAG: hypothetical protein EBS34_13725, partial [Flavobacteriales bacterium]|nr:hypothetical protein [Flavobacteriales bacterium]
MHKKVKNKSIMRINECSCGCGGASDKCMKERGSNLNYMFFGNLETLKRMIDDLLEMNEEEVDNILKDGHDWAVDHIASSLDDVQEVYNFIKTNSSNDHRKEDSFAEEGMFVKTFENYLLTESKKKDQD